MESLARLLEEQGDLSKATRVLERAAADRYAIFYPPSGPLWVRIQWRLAQLYRKTGRTREAEKIEAELRRLLARADEDHAIFRALNGQQPAAAAVRTPIP